jgi:DNA-binding NtrC family response regulator
VLVADTESATRQVIGSILSEFCHVSLASSAEEVLAALSRQRADVLLLDARLCGGLATEELAREAQKTDPTVAVFFLTDAERATPDTRQPVAVYLPRALVRTELGRMRLVLSIDRAATVHRCNRQGAFRRRQNLRAALLGSNLLIGVSPATAALREEIQRAATSDLNVLITGETGVGKGLVAEAVHHAASAGNERPFVALDLPALPPTLFESELFGHARGAFTGATSTQIGAFEAADEGTLFLDEIGEIQPPLQAKLLRAAETKSIRRVGDPRELRLNVRIVAATNRDIEADVAAGRFRADLFQRLNETRVQIPPLRERRDDIVPLFEHFLGEFRIDSSTPFELSDCACAQLAGYGWPGNVRELRTLARRLIARGLPSLITAETLLPLHPARVDRAQDSDLPPDARIMVFSRRVYMETLSQHRFCMRDAARALGLPYPTLRSRLKALDLLDMVKQQRATSDADASAVEDLNR